MAPLVLILTSGTVMLILKDTILVCFGRLVVPVPLVAPLVLILKDTILVCCGKVSSSCPTSGTVSVNIKGHDTRMLRKG